MGTHNQPYFKLFFTDNSLGIDLGNVEVKFSSKTHPQWSLRLKDLKSEFLVFFSELTFTWYFLHTKELPPIKHRKNTDYRDKNYHFNYDLSFAKKWAYTILTQEELVMQEFEEIVKNPKKHLNWVE